MREDVIKDGRYSKDYSCIEFDVGSIKKDGKFASGGEKGEILTLTANCGKIKPYRLKTKVSVHPDIYSYGIVSTPDLYEEGYEGPIVVKLLLEKDLDAKKELGPLVRVYIIN